jgi:hypothetical protein
MLASARLLACLDAISSETAQMLNVLDESASAIAASELREAKRRVLEIRAKTQELFEWISEPRWEDGPN